MRVVAPVRAGLMTRERLLDLVRKRIAEDSPPEEIRREATLLKMLGLLPAGADYEALIHRLLGEAVAGIYDTKDRSLYVLADLDPAEAELTLWHEIVHALQDQNYSIGDRHDALDDDGDRQIALRSVCEGDATITGALLASGLDASRIDILLPRDPGALRAMLALPAGPDAVPEALLRVLAFPYVEGTLFVRDRMEPGSLPSIGALFRKPPQSTEQVMHPERYARGDAPVRLRFGPLAPPLESWTVAYDDTFGEMGVRIWIEHHVSASLAAPAAEGWGGDRIALVEPPAADEPQGPAPAWVLWQTAWDPAPPEHSLGSSGEAIEFERAAVRTLVARFCADGGPEQAGRHDAAASPWTLDAPPSAVAGVLRDGRRVFVAIGPAGRLADVAPTLRALAAPPRPEAPETL